LRIPAAAAAAFGYRIALFHNAPTGERIVLLWEDPNVPRRRHWGTFVLRVDSPRPFAVQVPRPGLEGGSYEYGVDLFMRLSARYAIFAGSHPWANRNGLADLCRTESRQSLFQLIHQATVRHDAEHPLLAIQVRTRGLRSIDEESRDDVLLALGDGTTDSRHFSPLVEELNAA